MHVVAIDPFYDSSVDLVRKAIRRALRIARDLGAKTVALPALATGYGHLSMEHFAFALAEATQEEFSPVERIVVVVRNAENRDIMRKFLDGDPTNR